MCVWKYIRVLFLQSGTCYEKISCIALWLQSQAAHCCTCAHQSVHSGNEQRARRSRKKGTAGLRRSAEQTHEQTKMSQLAPTHPTWPKLPTCSSGRLQHDWGWAKETWDGICLKFCPIIVFLEFLARRNNCIFWNFWPGVKVFKKAWNPNEKSTFLNVCSGQCGLIFGPVLNDQFGPSNLGRCWKVWGN